MRMHWTRFYDQTRDHIRTRAWVQIRDWAWNPVRNRILSWGVQDRVWRDINQ